MTGHPGSMSARRAKSGTTLVGEVVTPFWYQGRANTLLTPPPPAAMTP
jgi:hypothetical protein